MRHAASTFDDSGPGPSSLPFESVGETFAGNVLEQNTEALRSAVTGSGRFCVLGTTSHCRGRKSAPLSRVGPAQRLLMSLLRDLSEAQQESER
jgi:hypothetical protein